MPPTNITAADAIVISSLPYSTTQDVSNGGGLPYTVWYTYTPTSSDEVLSLWQFGNIAGTYTPTSRVAYDSGGGPGTSIWHGITLYPQTPIMFPCEPGTQLWFRAAPTVTDNDPAAELTFELRSFAQSIAPEGSLFINDESSQLFPSALLSSSTGDPIQYITPFPGGESMVQLLDGTLLLQDIDNTRFAVYTAEYVYVATIPTIYNNIHLTTNRTTFFYAADSVSKVVTRYTAMGVESGGPWTVASSPSRIGVSRDDTILYYASGAAAGAVKRWDLVNNMALSDLVAGIASFIVKEIFVLDDGTVLVVRRHNVTGSNQTLFRYSAAGAQITDYSALMADVSGGDTHLAFANDDPDSFWLWIKTAGGFSKFTNVDTVAGTAISPTPFSQINYTNGSYNGAETATPSNFFGASESCTFVITRLSGSTPTDFNIRELIPRRQRRATHLSSDQFWVFYSQFQLDLQAGMGLTTGQGSEPLLMVRWSDDGGHAWSKIRYITAGRRGQYDHRAIVRRLSRARDRVFEVTVSDPIPWNLLAAYLDLEQGHN